MTILENLWYGNIRPVETFVDGNTEYRSLLRLVSKNREAFENELTQKQLGLFEKYNASVNEMNSVSEFTAFKYGFNIAIKMFLEIEL